MHVDVKWMGEGRFDAGRPGRPTIRIDTNSQTGPGPIDTLLCALCACTSEDLLGILEKRRTPVTNLQIHAVGLRAKRVPARIESIDITYHIDGEAIEPDQALRAVHLAIEKYCSVRDTLDPAIPITYTAIVNGARATKEAAT